MHSFIFQMLIKKKKEIFGMGLVNVKIKSS